jgi:hypothetical protein
MGCGLQSGAAQSEFQSVFSTIQSAGGDRFSVKSALSLFLSGLIVPHRSRQIPETVALYYTPNKTKIPGKGNIHLVTERSKLSVSRYLINSPDPGSIKVNRPTYQFTSSLNHFLLLVTHVLPIYFS